LTLYLKQIYSKISELIEELPGKFLEKTEKFRFRCF